jgi:NADH-quinone oxidoreductase subunit N
MNTGAFLFIALAEHWDIGPTFKDYRGLGLKAPLVSVAMTIFLFSLAGLPTGGGFLTKYVLFMAAIGAGFWWLAAIGAINSALSLYFYSRMVKALWIDEPISDLNISSRRIPLGIYAAIFIAALITILSLPFFSIISDFAMTAANVLLS